MTTEEIKSELIHAVRPAPSSSEDCCARAEICAAVLLSGGLSFRGFGRYALTVSVTHAAVSRYYFSLIKRFLGVTTEIRTAKTSKLGEITKYELVFPDNEVDKCLDLLKLRDDEALFGLSSVPAPEVVAAPCCRSAFLKSAFLTTGSMTNPEKAYELTLSCASEEMALALRELLASRSVKAGVSARRSQFITYIKEAESVRTFLALTGAHSAVLKLDDLRIVKQCKVEAQRLSNCDDANINRTVKSAKAQMEDISLLLAHEPLETLPVWARELASLRFDEPNASYTELGALCDPPLTKSSVSKRLKRLSEMAEKYK